MCVCVCVCVSEKAKLLIEARRHRLVTDFPGRLRRKEVSRTDRDPISKLNTAGQQAALRGTGLPRICKAVNPIPSPAKRNKERAASCGHLRV